jgi:hypothetical protein
MEAAAGRGDLRSGTVSHAIRTVVAGQSSATADATDTHCAAVQPEKVVSPEDGTEGEAHYHRNPMASALYLQVRYSRASLQDEVECD